MWPVLEEVPKANLMPPMVFRVLLAVGISGFQLSGQVVSRAGHLWEWKGAEREPFLGGVWGPPVEVGGGVLSLARSVLYLLHPCVPGGGVSGRVGVGICSSRVKSRRRS